MHNMIRHQLKPEEISLAKLITDERQENKREMNVESQKVDDSQGEDEVALVGTIGEVAVAHEFDLDLNRIVQASGDDGWDLKLEDITFEIKTRRGEKKDFAMYDDETDIEADIAVLCWYGGLTVTIVGWVTRAEWLLIAETLHFGNWKRRGIPWRRLRDPKILYRLTKQYRQNE